MNKINIFFSGLFMGMLILYVIIMIVLWLRPIEPTAMAVYRGETTLEITYRDGVPVDSVVVFR